MDADVLTTPTTRRADADPELAHAPYAASWANRLIDTIERLPGPAWLAYLLGLIPATILVSVPDWASSDTFGSLRLDRVLWAFALVGSAWLIHHLDGVARRALGQFSSLLDVDTATLQRLEYELTVIPSRPALLILLFSAVRTAQAFVFQPETEAIAGMSPVGIAIRYPWETVLSALVFTLLYHTARQLRLVRQIHAMAPRVNLFRPAPLYAFSTLTSQTAIGLMFLVVPFGFGISLAVSALEWAFQGTAVGGILVIAILAFVTPLLGMHRRMAHEKQRLQGEVGARIEQLIGDLHGSVDRRDLSGADGQTKALASLIAERDLVNRLSTWPWQAGTAGAVASAIVLPIVLWLTTRALERVL